ncbi:MAG: flagellar basal body-associated FliL family protein [Rhodobacter sp.]|nr:flagellar basal body-associated FliL family protein [Rhodobacter sp.]
MADDDAEAEAGDPKKKSKKPLIFGAVLALVLGGAGFFAVYSGMILAPHAEGEHATMDDAHAQPLPSVAFVPIDPLVINLGRGSSNRHLKFRAELEVEPATQSEVAALLPRVTDVLNGYLRALNVAELEEPAALIKLRAQMLRRVQIVTGEGRVRDLLIMEFVLN